MLIFCCAPLFDYKYCVPNIVVVLHEAHFMLYNLYVFVNFGIKNADVTFLPLKLCKIYYLFNKLEFLYYIMVKTFCHFVKASGL